MPLRPPSRNPRLFEPQSRVRYLPGGRLPERTRERPQVQGAGWVWWGWPRAVGGAGCKEEQVLGVRVEEGPLGTAPASF